jgi:hypothetical protein
LFRGFGFAGVVEPFVEVAGFGEFAAAVVGVAVGTGLVLVPVPVAGVADVGVLVAGKVVTGVGSGGNGFVNTLAMNSGRPSTLSLCRNLYQLVSSSIHSFFLGAYLASLPASATARA